MAEVLPSAGDVTYFVPHRKDPWPVWAQTTTASTTITSFDDPWSTWNQSITMTGTGDPWLQWNSAGCVTCSNIDFGTGSTTTTIEFMREQSGIWTSWARGPDIVVVSDYSARHAAEERRRERERDEYRNSPEGRAERERREAASLASAERWRVKHAEEKRLRKLAEDKAETLLNSVLTPAQRDEYKRLQRFKVYTASGNVYRVERGRQGNLKRVEIDGQGREKVVESLCVHPVARVPDQDTMVAQLLMLQTDEGELRELSNIMSVG